MTKQEIENIARVTHEANRAFCLTLGDSSQVSWDDAPKWQTDSAIAGVQSVIDGTAKSPSEQHEAWSQHKLAEGWVYGPIKNATSKTHPCLVPYTELPSEQRMKDHLFRAIVVTLTAAV